MTAARIDSYTLADFDFDLPPDLIAQHPAAQAGRAGEDEDAANASAEGAPPPRKMTKEELEEKVRAMRALKAERAKGTKIG